MKARMHFDTLTYANKLKAAGMDPKLAEVQALALVEALDDGMATKGDIADLRSATQADIADLKSATQADIADLRSATQADIADLRREMSEFKLETKANIASLKSELIQWMVGLFITNITIVGAFIALGR